MWEKKYQVNYFHLPLFLITFQLHTLVLELRVVIFHESLGDILSLFAWWTLSVQVFLESYLYWVSSGETSLKPSWTPFKEFKNGSEGVWSVSCDFFQEVDCNLVSYKRCISRTVCSPERYLPKFFFWHPW